MDKREQIAESLKTLRLARGLTQQELARATGISQQNISRWELGIHIPNLADCITLADFYGISLDDLADRDPTTSSALRHTSPKAPHMRAQKRIILLSWKPSWTPTPWSSSVTMCRATLLCICFRNFSERVPTQRGQRSYAPSPSRKCAWETSRGCSGSIRPPARISYDAGVRFLGL